MLHYLNWHDYYNVWWSIIPLVVFVVAVVTMIVWTVAHRSNANASTSSTARAEQVLLSRFASGQIDAAECRERLDTLRHSP